MAFALEPSARVSLRALVAFEMKSIAGDLGTRFALLVGCRLLPKIPLWLECAPVQEPRPHPTGELCAFDHLLLRFDRDEYQQQECPLPSWMTDIGGDGAGAGPLACFYGEDFTASLCLGWPQDVDSITMWSLLFEWREDNGALGELRLVGLDERFPNTTIRASMPRRRQRRDADVDADDIDFFGLLSIEDLQAGAAAHPADGAAAGAEDEDCADVCESEEAQDLGDIGFDEGEDFYEVVFESVVEGHPGEGVVQELLDMVIEAEGVVQNDATELAHAEEADAMPEPPHEDDDDALLLYYSGQAPVSDRYQWGGRNMCYAEPDCVPVPLGNVTVVAAKLKATCKLHERCTTFWTVDHGFRQAETAACRWLVRGHEAKLTSAEHKAEARRLRKRLETRWAFKFGPTEQGMGVGHAA